MNTLLLHPTNWDLMIDASRNIALAKDPYAKAQDVASACKVDRGELWYNTGKGVPYTEQVLGYRPAISQFKNWVETEALSVPGVVKAVVNITSYQDRVLTGQIKFTDQTGIENQVNINV